MMRHAQQRASTIAILSAKYGLLWLNDPVRYYDAYIPELSADQRKALIWRTRSKPGVDAFLGQRNLSYLPEAYWQVLAEALPELCATTRRPYAGLPMLTLYKILSNEVQGYAKNPARR